MGRTSTQALLAYTAPDAGACALEVSESPTFTPLVYDVDESKFSGSSRDDRPGNLSSGQTRLFVIGKRRAELAADGKRYSRALQAATLHYYRLTCGAAVVTGSFQTANIPLGSTHGEPLPVDPAHPGQYAWPTFDPTRRSSLPGNTSNEQHVDPLSGALIRRITLPGEAADPSLLNQSFSVARQIDGGAAWQNPSSVLADDTSAATFTGSSSNWLLVRAGTLDFGGGWIASGDSESVDYLQVTLKGSSAAATAADRTIQVCLTLDGANCASLIKDVVLAAAETTYSVPGTPGSMLVDWTAPGQEAIGRAALVSRSGTVNTTNDLTGSTVTWTGGAYFNTQWGAGSKLTIGGVEYTIASIASPQSLKLVENAGAQSGAAYAGSNFGILIRKKSSSADSVSIQYAGFSLGVSLAPVWSATGSADMCTLATVNDANGKPGYYCAVPYPGGNRHLYWIGQDTIESRYLGLILVPGTSGVDSYQASFCTVAGGTFDPVNPHLFYCNGISNDGNYKPLILQVNYRNASNLGSPGGVATPSCASNGNVEPCFATSNLTLPSQGKDLAALIKLFDPSFDVNFFGPNCALAAGLENTLLLISCLASVQDTIGWLAIYDLSKNPAALNPADPLTYANNPIIAAADSYSKLKRRWCLNHSPGGPKGSSNLAVMAINDSSSSGPVLTKGYGPWRSKVVSGDLSLVFQACPPNSVDPSLAGQLKCSTVVVDGEPCDPSPAVTSTGTIAVTNGSTTLTGSGTGWSFPLQGADIVIAGVRYRFSYGGSSTAGVLDRPYAGATATGLAYEIQQEPRNCTTVGRESEFHLQDAQPGDLLAINEGEIVQLLQKNAGNQWVLQRAYRTAIKPAQDYSTAASVWLYCMCETQNRQNDDTHPGWWWDFRLDAHGNGSGVVIDPLPGSHAAMSQPLSIGDLPWSMCLYPIYTMCYIARSPISTLTDLSNGYKINSNPPFAGQAGLGYLNTVESHLSWQQLSAPPEQQRWFVDMRPFLSGPTGEDNPLAQLVPGATQLYKIATNVNGNLLPLARKQLATFAFCGTNVLQDISSAATGNRINDGAADAYRYCVARQANECRSSSLAGEIFVNCPYLQATGYNGITCNGGSGNNENDLCIGNQASNSTALSQFFAEGRTDWEGKFQRVLSQAFQKYRRYDIFWNAKIMPDASWILFRTGWLWAGRNEVLALKVPPAPVRDSVSRQDFVPVAVHVTPPAQLAADNVVVQFGYAENGEASSFYCTSRQEACIKGNQSGSDYGFASDAIAGVPCATGCSVTLPALPQRVLYYRLQYRNALNGVLATGQREAVAVP